ncbi:MAG: winged helix-turn-helix transcriptional regulator [Spirochaetaceae bacterium]|nr:winged helix-turn-helix transcriptional regulator [Spirochaetaceae bacterium]
MSINTEDCDILEYSLSTIKRISLVLADVENRFYNEKLTKDEYSITKRQADILLYLNDYPSPPSIRELSRYLSTSHQNLKTICTNLEEKQLLKFVNDSKDKRKQRIKLTIMGESEAYKLSKAMSYVSQAIVPTLSSREIDELSKLLRKIETSIYEQSTLIKKDLSN